MIFGESSFPALPGGLPPQRRLARSKCPHCRRAISIPIDRLRTSGATTMPRRAALEARPASPAPAALGGIS
jgi:hypothetical protein